MRIRPITDAVQSFTRISSKEDKEHSGGSDQSPQHDTHQEKDQHSPEVRVEKRYEDVSAAVESFVADKQALVNGLTASMSGSGPGLRVILKDGSGAVVRQMSGEEFLRLRETVNQDASQRGKILDQKL